jgi:hypothetical protein
LVPETLSGNLEEKKIFLPEGAAQK